MGLGFGKWKRSPEIWTEQGPQSISFLCPVPRKETWGGVPKASAGDAGIAEANME